MGQPMSQPLTVVTGASGHIGGNLVRALLARGRRVRAVVNRDDEAVRGLDVEVVRADVCDAASVRAALGGADVVFHLAARISIVGEEGGLVQAVNVGGTRNVVAACREHGVRRLVHFSSVHAFSSLPFGRSVDEESEPSVDPRLPAYDRSKAAGEREVLAGVAQGLDAVIVNPLGVLGPHDYGPSRMGQVLIDLHRRKVPMLVQGGFNWVDVRDVVEGALAAEERGRVGTRYLLGGHFLTIPELARLASRVTGIPTPRLTAPMWLAQVGVPFILAYAKLTRQCPMYTHEALHALRAGPQVSYERAARELGYRPRPIEETIEHTYRWFREAGRL